MRTRPWAQSTRRRRLGALRAFLNEQRDDGLTGMPSSAVIHFAEMPRVALQPPQGLDQHLFDQLIDAENLALLANEQHRTVILLLAHTGLRVSSLVLLRRDALQEGSDGHPYLRFDNVKLSREAVIPIAPALAEQLRCQEAHLRRLYPDGTEWLLPSPPARGAPGMGKGGRFHILPGSVNDLLRSYVRKADIRDRGSQWVSAQATNRSASGSGRRSTRTRDCGKRSPRYAMNSRSPTAALVNSSSPHAPEARAEQSRHALPALPRCVETSTSVRLLRCMESSWPAARLCPAPRSRASSPGTPASSPSEPQLEAVQHIAAASSAGSRARALI